MRIAELARRAGVSNAALRYYEAQGLLAPTGRTEAGYRLYGRDALGRLGFIQRAKALGLSLREVRALLREPRERTDAAGDVDRLRAAVAHKLTDTRRRIGELQTLARELEALQEHLGRGKPWCGRIGDCGCWLPTREEVIKMTELERETGADDACATDCADDCSCDCGDDCGCEPGCC